MDALLAKIEGAPTGVKLLMVLAEAQDLMVGPEGASVALQGGAGSKMDLIAGVTAWRDAHDAPEWTQVTAMVFGEVLKAFDAAVLAVAAEAAVAEAAAAPIMAAQLVGARARVEKLESMNAELANHADELVKTNTEQTDRIGELEALLAGVTTQLNEHNEELGFAQEQTNELKDQNRRLKEQLRELKKANAAGMVAAQEGLRQREAARQAVVRRRESEEADAAAAAALAVAQQAEEDERAAAKAARERVANEEKARAAAAAQTQRRAAAAEQHRLEVEEKNTEAAAAAAAVKTCGRGHTLKVYMTPGTGTCDGCSKYITRGTTLMDCRRCNYYLCGQCDPRSLGAVERIVGKTCRRGHSLKPYKALQGSCDGCSTFIASGTRVMDCRACNYYLCSQCNLRC